LVVTEEGGKLVNTRAYRKDENRFDRNVVLALGQTGDAALSVKTDYRGVKYDNRMPLLLAGTEDKKRMILDEINIPGTEILNFNYTEDRGQIPVLKENLELGILRYAALSGTRLLVPLVALNRQRDIPKKVASRRSDVIIRRSSVTVDSVTVLIPAGFVLESAPSEIKTESRFGSYSLKVTPNGDNKLLCIRRLELNKGTNPASTYNELVDFYKKIAVSDNTKISLKKS
jgi:hypothetical protein